MTWTNGLKEGYVIINHACENVFSPIRMKPVEAYHNPNLQEPNTPSQATFHKCLPALDTPLNTFLNPPSLFHSGTASASEDWYRID